MGKIKLSKRYGIHTIELYAKNLKYIEVQKTIDFLVDHGKIYDVKSDPYNIDRRLKSTYFVSDGIRLRIYQSHNKSSGIGFIINPSTILSGKYQPVKLWEPTEAAVDALLKSLDIKLEGLGLSSVQSKDLSLSEMDLTANIWYEKGHDLAPHIRCFYKCFTPRRFKVISGRKGKRRYLFVMKNNTVAVKAYDKIYDLKDHNRCPKSLRDESMLRFEVSLKREAFLKKLNLDRKASLYDMLLAGYESGRDILSDYYGEMFPFSGCIVQYEKAKEHIETSIAKPLLKEQMLYLLRKTSDSAGLSAAVHKLEDHYENVDNHRIKKIFSEFDRLGIAPITRPNS